MIEIDDMDRRILAALEADSRLSHAEIGARIGLSASSVWRRVKALEAAGVITRYAAILDPAKTGRGFQAIVAVEMRRHDQAKVRAFEAALRSHPAILAAWATTGTADYHLRVACASIEDYNRFLDEFLFRQPAVQSAQTHVVLREIRPCP